MAQIINDPFSGNAFGRLGKGIGQGLSEQLPKEIERTRLASGLKNLEQEKNLDPMQFLTRAISIPGITPQAIESLGKLAQQRMKAQGLKNFGAGEERPARFPEFAQASPNARTEEGLAPSITTRTPIEATLNPYIPKSFKEIQQRAAEMYNIDPGFFQHDPNQAIQAATQEDAQEQSINQALQGQRTNEQNVQSTVTSALRDQFDKLGAKVPSNTYSDIENEAINAVKSVKDGGRGLTEQEAMKEYGTKLDKISRDYASLDALGKYTLMGKKPSETAKAIKSLQHKFAERNDLENFANELTARNGLSPSLAFNLAYPLSMDKSLDNEYQSLPSLNTKSYKYKSPQEIKEASRIQTKKIAPSLADKLNSVASPLSIAHELQRKGYDPVAWLDYLRDHREKLDLTERQARELDKATSFVPPLNDIWLETFGGMGK